MKNKAFSAILIKTFHEERREIEGIASTPALDRVQDIVEPLGLTFSPDAPLLLNHDHSQPVGSVQFGTPTAKGLPFVARIARVEEPGVVKDRTDEAWHSVKSKLIKGVSIGFIPEASEPLSNGGTRFTKARVHELSLVAIPCNPQAVITAFKSLRVTAPPTNAVSPLPETKSVPQKQTPSAAQINHTTKETSTMQNMKNIFIRRLIAKAMFDGNESGATGYAEQRWGATAGITNVLKSLQGPITTDSAAGLIAETLSRDEFVRAVFSQSILGQLQGLTRVPALARVNVETAPIAASFVGEYAPANAYQGAFGVTLSDKRKVGLIAVLSAELIRMSNDAAENIISAQLQRALSRGLDNAFLGSQARDAVTPTGLGAVAVQIAAVSAGVLIDSKASFDAGVAAFTGDLSAASLLVNPRTAVSLRSASDPDITAKGGMYGGLPAIASYGVPAGKLFIVDASRVVTFLGSAELDVAASGMFPVDDGTGTVTPTQTGMFQTSQQAIRATQYADWAFVDGAAVEISLTA